MKKILILLCVCVCELCYSQEMQQIFLRIDKDISYEPTSIDKTLKQILSIDPQITFNVYREGKEDNNVHLRFHQFLNDYRIEGSDLLVHVRNNKIAIINGSYYTSVKSAIKSSSLSESEILQIAENDVFASKSDYDFQYKTEKIISPNYFESDDKNLYYACKVLVTDKNNLETDVDVIIDEKTGNILGKFSRICYANGTASTRYSGSRTIGTTLVSSNYVLRDLTRGNGIFTKNANHTTGSILTEFTDANNVWTAAEFHNSNKDDGALDAHWAAMKTYDYFYNKFQRNSYDNAGAAINCLVHYGTNYENAFWKSSDNVLCFGDGYTNFDILTSVDVVAHELGHAVCTNTANLNYSGESGAINEGLSDIWAACVEDYYTTDKQTWLIGEDIDLRTGHVALRSMSNPNAEGQPDTYGGTYWVQTVGCTPTNNNDNCGVHTNSGVLNYWFYLLCQGGSGTNDLNNSYNVTGIGLDNAAKIVYRAETTYMNSTTNYASLRAKTIQAAMDLFPNNPSYVASVSNAWHAVGVDDCPLYTLANQNINTNTSINECSVEVYNVTVGSNSSLDIDFQEEAVLLHDVEIQAGSTLNIH